MIIAKHCRGSDATRHMRVRETGSKRSFFAKAQLYLCRLCNKFKFSILITMRRARVCLPTRYLYMSDGIPHCAVPSRVHPLYIHYYYSSQEKTSSQHVANTQSTQKRHISLHPVYFLPSIRLQFHACLLIIRIHCYTLRLISHP